jgi:hypothetical protein
MAITSAGMGLGSARNMGLVGVCGHHHVVFSFGGLAPAWRTAIYMIKRMGQGREQAMADLEQNGAGLGRNLTYGLLDVLGRQIVTGAFEGTRFPTEAELSAQHGISRSVTREAVKMLTAKGLLTARPRQGTSVQPVANWNLFDTDVLHWLLERKFSVDLLAQFNQLRAAIEPAAAASRVRPMRRGWR